MTIEVHIDPSEIDIRCFGCKDELATTTRRGGLLVEPCPRCIKDAVKDELELKNTELMEMKDEPRC